MNVWRRRMSTKLAGIPSARSATYPASSLLACDGADNSTAQNSASQPFGKSHAGPAHDPHHRGPGTRLEWRQVRRPGAHAPGNDHVLQPHAWAYVAGDDPQPRPSADPVHRGEAQAYHHPPPVQVQQRAHDSLEVLAIHDEDDDYTGQGDYGEELQPAAEQAWREGEGHVVAKLGGLGARG